MLGIGAFLLYYFYFTSSIIPLDELYEVESPSKKEIKQIISATGSLTLKDQVKVGSVVTGRVKGIYVEENDTVREGQLMIEIDTGLDDTEVREAEGLYEKALAELEYHEADYHRKRKLFNEKFLSEADLEEATYRYRSSLGHVKALKGSYDKKLIAFENHNIYAPTAGIVIHIDVAKGEKVSSDVEGGLLLSLAPDIKKIEAELEVSEKDIGQIQKGQTVNMVVDTYPHRVFESTIHNISFTPKIYHDKECIYLAKAYIDNPHLLLRPGMSVNATLEVAAVDSALSLSSRAFLIKQEHLQPIAELLNYQLLPLAKSEKQALLKMHQDENRQFIWVVSNDSFREIPVEIGVTDNLSFEIKSGLKGDEKLVVDVMEEDEMQKIYEKFYRKL